MCTVSCTECIVYIEVSHRSELCCELRIVLCLFLVETDILEHEDLAVLESCSLSLSILTDNVSSQSNGLADELCETICCRLHGELSLRSVLRTSEVGNEDNLRIVVYEVLDRGKCSLDTLVVCDLCACLFVEGYVKVYTNDNALTCNVQIFDTLLVIHCHGCHTPSTRFAVNGKAYCPP